MSTFSKCSCWGENRNRITLAAKYIFNCLFFYIYFVLHQIVYSAHDVELVPQFSACLTQSQSAPQCTFQEIAQPNKAEQS